MAFIASCLSVTHPVQERNALQHRRLNTSSFTENVRMRFSSRSRLQFFEPSMNLERKEEKEFQSAEEKRLQNDKKYVFREFGKISAAAIGIGLVLLFYDLLISLIAVGIGSIYAIAVLFEVRGADTLPSRAIAGTVSMWRAFVGAVRDGYRAIRREVRKGLED